MIEMIVSDRDRAQPMLRGLESHKQTAKQTPGLHVSLGVPERAPVRFSAGSLKSYCTYSRIPQ